MQDIKFPVNVCTWCLLVLCFLVQLSSYRWWQIFIGMSVILLCEMLLHPYFFIFDFCGEFMFFNSWFWFELVSCTNCCASPLFVLEFSCSIRMILAVTCSIMKNLFCTSTDNFPVSCQNIVIHYDDLMHRSNEISDYSCFIELLLGLDIWAELIVLWLGPYVCPIGLFCLVPSWDEQVPNMR